MTEEDKIQAEIVRDVRLVYPKSKLFSVPNGGFRFKTTAFILQATGQLPGVSDLIFIHRGRVVFVEVKSQKGVQSEHQKKFERDVRAEGFEYWLVRSANEMLERIKDGW